MSISATEVRLISRLLERALALPSEQREAFLQGLPEYQQPLVPRLRERLEQSVEPVREGEPEPPPPPRPRPPPRAEEFVGPYKLLKPLSAPDPGAQPTLWRAERMGDAEHRPLVLRLGTMPGTQGSKGPGAEAASDYQVVNLPEHPQVQRIVDAGFDERGRFYRVMPFVEGTSLVEHVRHRGVGLARRAELMLDVSALVALAHVERVALGDLSDATLRVADDGARLVLLDWGRGRTLRADTAQADLLALGRVFRAFFENDGLTRQPSPGADLAAVMHRLQQTVPSVRYASVAALLDDLQRVIHHRPVAGAHDTPVHRTKLFMRRHRLHIAGGAAGVAVLALAASLLGQNLQSRQDQAQRADEVEAYLAAAVPADTSSDPAVLAPRLQAALEQARTGFDGKPVLRGQVIAALGVRFRALGQPEQATAVLREAYTLLQGNAKPGDPALHTVQAELAAQLQSGPGGKPAEAQGLAREVLASCSEAKTACREPRALARKLLGEPK